MKRITTLLTVMLLAGAVIAVGAPVASATGDIEGPSLNIPVGTVVRGPAESTHVLGSSPVAEELQGMVCEVKATAINQSSVHPGNDLVVASNGDSVTLHNVEREGFVTTTADEDLQLGDTLSVTLVMGADRVFSGGIVVTTTCNEPEPVQQGGDSFISCDTGDVEGEYLVVAHVYDPNVAIGGSIDQTARAVIDGVPKTPANITENLGYETSWVVEGGTIGVDESISVGVEFLNGDTWTEVYTNVLSWEVDGCYEPPTTTTTAPPETTTTVPEVTTTTAPPTTTETPTTLPPPNGDAGGNGSAGGPSEGLPVIPAVFVLVGLLSLAGAWYFGEKRRGTYTH